MFFESHILGYLHVLSLEIHPKVIKMCPQTTRKASPNHSKAVSWNWSSFKRQKAPKMRPKGSPKGSQKSSKRVARGPRDPNGDPQAPQGTPRAPQGSPEGPKEAQMTLKVCKTPQHTINTYNLLGNNVFNPVNSTRPSTTSLDHKVPSTKSRRKQKYSIPSIPQGLPQVC